MANPVSILQSTITPLKDASPSAGKCFTESFFKNLFKEIDLADRNSTKCWSLCTNKDYWESVPHDHLETSTINTVYYLQIPKIGNNFCGKIRFLINNEWEDYQPKPNELLIIPNCLVHDTTFHNTEEWRISLNFEIITNNKLYLK